MTVFRRDFLKLASTGLAGATAMPALPSAFRRKPQPCRARAQLP